MTDAKPQLPADLFADLDRSGPLPLYYQVAQTLENAIRAGVLPPGSRLENEVALGERLKLSRPTVRRAIQDLVDKGLLVRRRGIGTQVLHGQVTRNVELTSLFEDLAGSGQSPRTRLLDYGIRACDAKSAAELGISPGTPVLYLSRLRSADGTALAIMNNVLSPENSDIDEQQLGTHGLYQILRQRGVTMKVAKQRIGARAATAEEAKLLDLHRGSPLLTMSRAAFDNAGRAVEFGTHVYRPDLYSFEMTVVGK